MASYNFNKPTFFPAIQPFTKIGTGIPTPSLKKFYFQRAWNTAELMYETWISEGSAQPTPPSGDSVTGLTTASFWKQTV